MAALTLTSLVTVNVVLSAVTSSDPTLNVPSAMAGLIPSTLIFVLPLVLVYVLPSLSLIEKLIAVPSRSVELLTLNRKLYGCPPLFTVFGKATPLGTIIPIYAGLPFSPLFSRAVYAGSPTFASVTLENSRYTF